MGMIGNSPVLGSVVPEQLQLGSLVANAIAFLDANKQFTSSSALTFNGTSLSMSANPTLNGGTANGVAYLNGSKVLTTGSALVFDGSNLGLGVTPSAYNVGRAVEVGAAGNAFWTTSNDVYLTANTFYQSGYKYAASTFASMYEQTSGTHRWFTAPSGTAGNAITFTQAMTLTAAGRLGIGTTSPGYTLDVAGVGYIQGIEVGRNGDSIRRNGDLYVGVDGASSNLCFFTNSGVERARIDNSGNFMVGTTGLTGGGRLQVSSSSKVTINSTQGAFGLLQLGNPNSAGETAIAFIPGVTSYGTTATSSNGADYVWVLGYGTNGFNGFGIYNNGAAANVCTITKTSTSWSFPSDARLKDIDGAIESALDKVGALRPVYFTWKNDSAKRRKVGLIAQDVLSVLPEAVDVPESETDDNGKQRYLSMAMPDVVPLLVAAIQEQQAIIEQLKADVAALKGAE